MTDDIVARLRKFADYRATSDDLSRALWEAADLIEQQAASLAAKDGAIRLLDERCAQYERRAEQAERALAEAVEVLRPFAEIREALELISANKPGDVLQDERAIFQTGGLKATPTSGQTPLGPLRAARQFVKEHSANAGQ